MLPLFISPPFSNWVSHPACRNIMGSFTLEPRPGLIGQALRTIRPVEGGWVNAMGLRNKGIKKVKFDRRHVYSLSALHGEWEELLDSIPHWAEVELNLSCPNVEHEAINMELFQFLNYASPKTVKLPPDPDMVLLDQIYDAGGRRVHLSNTLRSPRGGISGQQQKRVNLQIVEKARDRYPDLYIIAGGGIYTLGDYFDYRAAGADAFSLSSIWFNPVRARRLIRDIQGD